MRIAGLVLWGQAAAKSARRYYDLIDGVRAGSCGILLSPSRAWSVVLRAVEPWQAQAAGAVTRSHSRPTRHRMPHGLAMLGRWLSLVLAKTLCSSWRALSRESWHSPTWPWPWRLERHDWKASGIGEPRGQCAEASVRSQIITHTYPDSTVTDRTWAALPGPKDSWHPNSALILQNNSVHALICAYRYISR